MSMRGLLSFILTTGIFQQQGGRYHPDPPQCSSLIHPIEKSKTLHGCLEFQLDLMGYSAMDQASIDYPQPLQGGARLCSRDRTPSQGDMKPSVPV